ncbi:MAG TPA: glucose-6-phosphate dehydrogenase, partial [Candidatus Saccharimonadales bacterium]|nr:glucose-6-phosphate dehydrogenase [Candidatus Saccharimonadales bacterium]
MPSGASEAGPAGAAGPAWALAENPLRAGLRDARRPDPCALVIFGASGDLTHRKLAPALYSLFHDQLLPEPFTLVGFARSLRERQAFVDSLRESCGRFARRPVDPGRWERFAAGITCVAGDFARPADFAALRAECDRADRERGALANRLFYLATPPAAFVPIVRGLGAAGMVNPDPARGPFTRVIVEKPYGHDLDSARALDAAVHEVFDEQQVFRIDHYLGKETVQNILVFRFGNSIFEPIWNRRYVDFVALTVSENLGMEGRGAYFDTAGILRDIVQNHMLQFLSLTAMEAPVAFEADAVRDEKVKLLRSLRLLPPREAAAQAVRGQYRAGSVLGAPVPGYLEEPGVAPGSQAETYVALRLSIDNWRWAGVPFYLRAGKRLPKRVSEIAIHFRPAPHLMFRDLDQAALEPNLLTLRIQPDEGITLKFDSKVPGPTVRLRPVNMEFRYGTSFGQEPPEAYERLILDCLLGDPTLFTRSDEIQAAWRYVTAVRQGWEEAGTPLAH